VTDRGIVALLGGNGAGKTTLARVLSGLLPIRRGSVRLDGSDVRGWRTERFVKAGVIQVPQGRLLFSQMSVQENLEMGTYRSGRGIDFAKRLAAVEGYFPILAERRHQSAGLLSGGEQQMLAIGRALMAAPRLLILDEPSLGLAPRIVREIFRVISRIHGEGIAVLLIEQNARLALKVSDQAYVLENGRVALSGRSAELLGNEEVREVYLGIA
jgi:branched-chain amino acid transport system ATP-binding protein